MNAVAVGDPGDRPRLVALRKALVFARRGKIHLAEQQINTALELGSPAEVIAAALDELPKRVAGSLLTRRQALARTALLLAGGVLAGVDLTRGSPAAAAGVPVTVSGLFLQSPDQSASDGSYRLSQITPSGVSPFPGSYRGCAFTDGAVIYNVEQRWGAGTATLTIDVLASKEQHRTVVAQPGYSSSALTTGSLTNATVRGTKLYVSNNCIRTYPGDATVATKTRNPPIRVSTQVDLQVIDLTTGTLVGSWQGAEGAGGSYTSLKVSDDGSRILLIVDSPGRLPGAEIVSLSFAGGSVTSTGIRTVDPMTVYGLFPRTYLWNASGALVQVGANSVNQYYDSTGRYNVAALPVMHGNARQPVPFQGAFWSDGTLVATTGDGRYWVQNPSGKPRVTSLTGPAVPAFLNYPATAVRDLVSAGNSRMWIVDNREGAGGIWALDTSMNPADHLLSGTYFSGCQAASSNDCVAAISTIESIVYLVHGSGQASAFRVPPYSALVPRS